MTSLNWAIIPDGGAFESLVQAILFAEAPGTLLFGRPGPDSGQDARSADGTTVYQAKFRQSMTMDVAVRLAMEELDNIRRYRQPGHPNHRHWQRATRWILVGNLSLNPNEVARWLDSVVPSFRDEGIIAECWGRETLEQKLLDRPWIRDAFFEAKNRVLISLKEAHDLLTAEMVGEGPLEKPFRDRVTEIDRVHDFASNSHKRILPITGPGGIGKTRLLYEALTRLSADDWRVLWGLPASLARSDSWFRGLAGGQRTCVALDFQEFQDPQALRVFIEQLSGAERSSWKVILCLRSEHASSTLGQLRGHGWVEDAIELEPLDDIHARELVRDYLPRADEPVLHKVCEYTNRYPGWLVVLGETARQRGVVDLPQSVDQIAASYVESCLNTIAETDRESARTLLRWMALWGRFVLDPEAGEPKECAFLAQEGVSAATLRDLLEQLRAAGMIRNWGLRRRFYAVKPSIVREAVLADWLLERCSSGFQVGMTGRRIIERIVRGQVPSSENALRRLAQLSVARLDCSAAQSFLDPILNDMRRLATEGSVLDQLRLLEVIPEIGFADPEGALGVLHTIRSSALADAEVEVPLFGRRVYTHGEIVAKLPWALFRVAEYVADEDVARRFLFEFEALTQILRDDDSGNGPFRLLERLICEARNSSVWASPATKIALQRLSSGVHSPFLKVLLESLLKPERESTRWTAPFTMAIGRWAIVPGLDEWALAQTLRERVWEHLESSTDSILRAILWEAISDSHWGHRRLLHDGHVRGHEQDYRKLLDGDLSACRAVLSSPPQPLGMHEGVRARALWEWYLAYGQPNDPVGLARECEARFNEISGWRVQDFFRFDYEHKLEPETRRVADRLRNENSVTSYAAFFTEARDYLQTERKNRDTADSMRIGALADALQDEFQPDNSERMLWEYIRGTVLRAASDENPFAWEFAVRLCQNYLRRGKEGSSEDVAARLRWLLDQTTQRSDLLYGMYANAHPKSIGPLRPEEVDVVLAEGTGLEGGPRFAFLGTLALADWGQIRPQIEGEFGRLDHSEASSAFAIFLRALYVANLRYEWPASSLPIEWMISLIRDKPLNGDLLKMWELEDLRDRSGFKLSIRQLVNLLESRMALPLGLESSPSFTDVPHNFSVDEWCQWDPAVPGDKDAFFDLCRLSSRPTFLSHYWIPIYVTKLDPLGSAVGEFITASLVDVDACDEANQPLLFDLARLAGAYPDTAGPWRNGAIPICERIRDCSRELRRKVYSRLSLHSHSGAYFSTPGQVPPKSLEAVESARQLRDAEPVGSVLREYREWALNMAETELERVKERAEEDLREV